MIPQRFVLIGHPVAHSLSPVIHTAAYIRLGLPHVYELVDCPDEASVRACFERLRSGELAGANVTVPWKRLALALADRADPLAADVGAANVICRSGGELVAYNTDVLALADELRCAAQLRSALVLGNGGASLASVAACRHLGCQRIFVSARKWSAEQPRSTWPRIEAFEALDARPVAWPEAAPGELHGFASDLDVLIQSTSAGMHGAESGQPLADWIPWERFPQHALIYDLVYNPPETPVLAAAKRAGLPHRGGLGMLVGQAASAIELWLQQSPPRGAMREAAEAALFGGAR